MKKLYTYSMPDAFMHDQTVPARWRLLGIINGFHINGKTFYASNQWIMKEIGCSEQTVSNAVKELEELGEIQCERTRRSRVIKRKLRDPNQLGSRPKSVRVSDPSQLGTNSDSNSDSIPSEKEFSREGGFSKELTLAPLEGEFTEAPPQAKRKPKYPNARAVFALWGKYPMNWNNHSTQLLRAENLFEERGMDGIKNALAFYKENKEEYDDCPLITSPSDLDSKWRNLFEFKKRHD